MAEDTAPTFAATPGEGPRLYASSADLAAALDAAAPTAARELRATAGRYRRVASTAARHVDADAGDQAMHVVALLRAADHLEAVASALEHLEHLDAVLAAAAPPAPADDGTAAGDAGFGDVLDRLGSVATPAEA